MQRTVKRSKDERCLKIAEITAWRVGRIFLPTALGYSRLADDVFRRDTCGSVIP